MGVIIAFALFGGLIYLFASRKSRRDDAVELRVRRMVSGGVSNATFHDLYFEAAKAYAIAKGATAADRDAASATMLVDGRTYFVVFMRERGSGTTISVRDAASVERELLSFASR
jgi:hypothetical protein